MRNANSFRTYLQVQRLEDRTTPASVFSFAEVDGDRVRITSSVGDLKPPMVETYPAGKGVQLQYLRLSFDDSKLGGLGFDVPEVLSRIDRATIGGQVRGTDISGDHYGIVAENIESLKIRGKSVRMTPGPNNDDVSIGDTGDFRVNEI
jgi:hypothetical protein